MELNRGAKALWKFIDEERRSIDLPTFSFLNTNNNEPDSQLTSARTSCVSTSSLPLIWPTSPVTPWIRSPNHAPSQSPDQLHYHCLASLHRKQGNIFSITATKDFIFTGSSSKTIHAWKIPDCTEMGFVKSTCGEIRAILAHQNLLITTHGDCKARLWEIVSSNESFRIKKITTLPQRKRSSFLNFSKKSSTSINDQHKSSISCIAYNGNEKLLYTGSWDQTVKVWKIPEKKCVDSFIAHEGFVNAIVINHEDGCVFTCSCDGTVKIWRRVFMDSSHILTTTLKFQQSPINALALNLNLSPNKNTFLYSGSSDGLISFWQKEKVSGRYNHLGFLRGHSFGVLCLVTMDDLILSGSEDGSIRIWRRDEEGYNNSFFHSCVLVIDGHDGPVKCLNADVEIGESTSGKCLLVHSASLDQSLKVWRVRVYEDGVKEEKVESVGWKMSPVLSPSWVEMKIQGSGL